MILFSAFAVQNIVAQSEKDTLKTAEIQEVTFSEDLNARTIQPAAD